MVLVVDSEKTYSSRSYDNCKDTCRSQPDLAEHCGLQHLHRVGPTRTYYTMMIDLNCIFGRATITRDVVTPSIQRGLLPRCRIEREKRNMIMCVETPKVIQVYVVNSAVMNLG